MYVVLCNGEEYVFHSSFEAGRYYSEWYQLGHAVMPPEYAQNYNPREGISMNTRVEQELDRLKTIKAKFEDTKDYVREMEDIVGMGDSTGHLDTALTEALTDLSGYIANRERKFVLMGVFTGNHKSFLYTPGQVKECARYTSKEVAERGLQNYEEGQHSDPLKKVWVFYLKEVTNG
jgi:hypothetical protein